jgi:antirestriction protein ArdC
MKQKESSSDKYINKILEELHSGVAPWRRRWLPSRGPALPVNYMTETEYAGSNKFYLLTEVDGKPPVFATYKQWASVGAQVKKGASSLTVVAPFFRKKEEDADSGGTEDVGTEPKKKELKGFKGYPVFHYTDLENPDSIINSYPEAVFDHDQDVEKIEERIEKLGIEIKYSMTNTATYEGNLIMLPEKGQFQSKEDILSELMYQYMAIQSENNAELKGVIKNFGDKFKRALLSMYCELGAMHVAMQMSTPFSPSRSAAVISTDDVSKVLVENPNLIWVISQLADTAVKAFIEDSDLRKKITHEKVDIIVPESVKQARQKQDLIDAQSTADVAKITISAVSGDVSSIDTLISVYANNNDTRKDDILAVYWMSKKKEIVGSFENEFILDNAIQRINDMYRNDIKGFEDALDKIGSSVPDLVSQMRRLDDRIEEVLISTMLSNTEESSTGAELLM